MSAKSVFGDYDTRIDTRPMIGPNSGPRCRAGLGFAPHSVTTSTLGNERSAPMLPELGDWSRSDAGPADPAAEVAAFVNKDKSVA